MIDQEEEIAALREEIADLRFEVHALKDSVSELKLSVKDLVDAFITAKGMTAFVKWFAAVITAITMIIAATKGYLK